MLPPNDYFIKRHAEEYTQRLIQEANDLRIQQQFSAGKKAPLVMLLCWSLCWLGRVFVFIGQRLESFTIHDVMPTMDQNKPDKASIG